MGDRFYVNTDGSITQNVDKKVVANIDWVDYKQIKSKHTSKQKFAKVFFILPIGWPFAFLSFIIARLIKGYWPFLGIKAIENTSETVKIYCSKKGKLGLYANKRRITRAKYESIQRLPPSDYPTFILEHNYRYCLYNHIQKKKLFKNSINISYVGNNIVEVSNTKGKTRYSIIGMKV